MELQAKACAALVLAMVRGLEPEVAMAQVDDADHGEIAFSGPWSMVELLTRLALPARVCEQSRGWNDRIFAHRHRQDPLVLVYHKSASSKGGLWALALEARPEGLSELECLEREDCAVYFCTCEWEDIDRTVAVPVPPLGGLFFAPE